MAACLHSRKQRITRTEDLPQNLLHYLHESIKKSREKRNTTVFIKEISRVMWAVRSAMKSTPSDEANPQGSWVTTRSTISYKERRPMEIRQSTHLRDVSIVSHDLAIVSHDLVIVP